MFFLWPKSTVNLVYGIQHDAFDGHHKAETDRAVYGLYDK